MPSVLDEKPGQNACLVCWKQDVAIWLATGGDFGSKLKAKKANWEVYTARTDHLWDKDPAIPYTNKGEGTPRTSLPNT